jgi:hypothetical protein
MSIAEVVHLVTFHELILVEFSFLLNSFILKLEEVRVMQLSISFISSMNLIVRLPVLDNDLM